MVDATADNERAPEGAGLRDRIRQLRARDKEISKSWKQRAKNRKFYRVLWSFASFTPMMILAISGINEFAGNCYAYFMVWYNMYLARHEHSEHAQTVAQRAWTVERYALWVPMILIGALMLFAIIFACYTYKETVRELSLVIPWLSIILAIAFTVFHVKYMHVLTGSIRHFMPDNLFDTYDFVLKFAVPVALIYTGVFGYYVAFVTYAVRFQLHRGFLKYGDAFRETDYYKEWTSTDVTPYPTIREQISLMREELRRKKGKDSPPKDANEKMPNPVELVRDMIRSVFPKDF